MGFCSNCGSEYKDGTVFCSHCGAKVGDTAQQPGAINPQGLPYADPQGTNPVPNTYENYNPESKKSNNKTIGIVVVAVAALLVLFLLVKFVGLFTTKGYEKPIQTMASAIEDKSFKKMMKAFPDYLSEKIEDSAKDYYDDIDEYMDEMIGSLEDQYGKKLKVTYKVKDKEKLDKDEINDLEDSIKDNYDEKVNIKAAYKLDVELTIKGSEDKDTDDDEITVIKIGSNWYLADNILG